MLTGLPIDGKPVVLQNKAVDVEECLTLVGVTPGTGTKKHDFKLSDLVTIINGLDNNPDDASLDKACRATALLGIACMVDNNCRTAISTKYLNLIRNVDDIKTFAWGAASWVNLHSSLRTFKEDVTKVGISGCSFALMVFAFVRIPQIVPFCYKWSIKEITPTFPLRNEYLRKINPKEFYNNCMKPDTYELLDVLSRQTEDDGMESDLNQDRVLVPNRTHVTNLKNKLIVFDLNGVLVDCVTDDKKLNPDFVFNKTAVFARPSYLEFLEFCFDNFEVGIWSSKFKTNIDKILDFFMKDLKHKFLFRWDQSHCTTTTIPTPENPDKNIMFKELEKLWDKEDPNLCWEKGFFNESNTLLIDDSPYKGMLNPEYNVIYPDTFKYWIGKWDKSLAKGGELRDFLEGLAKADDIRDYVREKSIGRPAVTTINDDNYRYFEAKNSVS
ncbi:unnamed protein product [Trifolium pratense]|uniref:Uncharacterized protein n=1 Tax=Trifolium pratense TaxID=57577 RepID=A0ACB0L1N8_TRIPR|nr:unnamed protein product [Trifolium pratense]